MKKPLTPLLFLVVLIAVTLSGFNLKTEPYLVKDFDMKGGGKLDANTVGGSISVTGTTQIKASVAVMITAQNGNTDKAVIEKALKDYTLEIRQENNTIIAKAARTKNNGTGKNELSISFKISVPQQTTCSLNTSGGSIALSNIKGNTKVETSGGSISLNQFAGALKAETSGGSISLANAEGTLDLNTSGGSIRLSKIAGDVNAQTSGGSITADIRKLGKYLNLETTGGSVTATIPGGKGLDLDLEGSHVKTNLSNFKGVSEKDRIKGSINGGGVPVKLHTTGGSAELKYHL